MKNIIILFTLISLVLIAGCSHSVTVRPNLDVTATIANQLDFKVGLYIPPEVRGFKMTGRANWATKYKFNVGESVSSIIYKSLSRVFKYVELIKAYPTEVMLSERAFDFVAIAKITEANVGLNVQGGFFPTYAGRNTQITASLAFFDSKLIHFTAVQATGTGIPKEGVTSFSTSKDEFSVSVESAIRNLGNNIVQQVYGNYDIRKRTEKK